jgi:phosphate-selective porin OprO/OprP
MKTNHTAMKYLRWALRATILGVAASAAIQSARAQSHDEEIQALREQIRQLDQKLRVLERKQELRDEEAATAAKSASKITATDKAFSIASGDAANSLRLRALVQADSRWFFDSGLNNNDAFLLRRARLIFEGQFNKIYQFQLVPEFGGTSGNGSLTVLDANITIALKPELQFKFGRFREPVGLEQLQADSVAFFAERSVVSQFVPNRDIGVQVGGDLVEGAINYALGVFNGVPDGTNNPNNTENNNKKDVAARVIFTPFKNAKGSPFQGLGFGVAGTLGRQNGAAGGLTSGYRTDGQQTYFTYRATTVAKGSTSRVSPQAFWYTGPFGLQAEYVVSSVDVVNGALKRSLDHKAWQVSGGYVLTGEDESYTGVVPKTTFSLDSGSWGAFELVARISHTDLDDESFTGGANSVANPANSATASTTFAGGVNLYLSKSVRASLDYFHTKFDWAPGVVPVSNTVIGNDENALITRLQLVF